MLFFLLAGKNPPIHDRAIRNDLRHSRIERAQNRRRPTKTSPNHKHFIRRQTKSPAECQLAKLTSQSINHIQNVQVRRPLQKLSATFPRPAITRIKHPISLARKKFSQRLLARNRRHPVAQDNHPLNFSSPPGRQEFRDNLALESSSEHLRHGEGSY